MRYVLQCENVYVEAARIANRICGLVGAGVRYKDIVVVICDYDETVSVYNQIFTESGIPVNVDVGMKLIDHPLVKHLRDLMLNTPWKSNEMPDAEENVLQKIIGILETIKRIVGGQRLSGSEFCNMFCTLCSAAKISDVPHYADRVLLVSAKEYEPSFVPYLFVTGASDSVFPYTTSDTDIITEQDIKNVSFRIEPSASMQNKRARSHAQNILNSAVKELCVSYSTVNIKGERTGASELINNEYLIMNIDRKEDLTSRVYAKQNVLTAIGNGSAFFDTKHWASVQAALNLDLQIPQLDKMPGNIKCGKQLFFPENKAHVTQIENFVKCPYYHFLTNGLRVKKRELDKIGANTIGTILHEFAEKFLKDKTPIEKIIGKYKLPQYTVAALKKQAKLIAKFLTEDIAKSEFKPYLFEHKLEKDFDGIKVHGIADRIDVADLQCKSGQSEVDAIKSAMVVDYKSGTNIGVKLQLPLYMSFLTDKYIPEAAYYLSLKNFKKTVISVDDIEPAVKQAQSVIADLKKGVIAPNPNHKSVCEYCPARVVCR